MTLYNNALEHNGAVSIGTGRANLFKPIVDLALKSLASAPDENVRYSLVVGLDSTFEIAGRHKLPGTAETMRKFAFESMPALLRQQQHQYQNTATGILRSVSAILPPKETLRLSGPERIEQLAFAAAGHSVQQRVELVRRSFGNLARDRRLNGSGRTSSQVGDCPTQTRTA